MIHTETHFGIEDFTPEDWKACSRFDDLQADVEAWLGHELTEQEEKDLVSLYLYYTEGY